MFLSILRHIKEVLAQNLLIVLQVLDGERGNDHRRMLLPSYKAHRKKFLGRSAASGRSPRGGRRLHQVIINVLNNCNVPVGETSHSLCYC